MHIESVMPSDHLILCRPLLLLPSIFPSIRGFWLPPTPRLGNQFLFSIPEFGMGLHFLEVERRGVWVSVWLILTLLPPPPANTDAPVIFGPKRVCTPGVLLGRENASKRWRGTTGSQETVLLGVPLDAFLRPLKYGFAFLGRLPRWLRL